MKAVLAQWLSSPPVSNIPAGWLALIFAAAVFLAMILVGFLIQKAEIHGLRILTSQFGRKAAWFIMYKLTFVGTVIHECAHAFVGWILGAKILKIKCFTLKGEQLGYVQFQLRGNKAAQMLQLGWLSCAPVLVGLILVPFCVWSLFQPIPIGWKVFAAYLGISTFIHMDMSNVDIKNYCKGAWGVIPVLYLIGILLYQGVMSGVAA